MTKQKSGCDYCKTNTLDKREKCILPTCDNAIGHDGYYCEEHHSKYYLGNSDNPCHKVKPEGVGEWKKLYEIGEKAGYSMGYMKDLVANLLLQEKAKWKEEIADKVRALDRHEVEEEGVIQDVLTLIDKL